MSLLVLHNRPDLPMCHCILETTRVIICIHPHGPSSAKTEKENLGSALTKLDVDRIERSRVQNGAEGCVRVRALWGSRYVVASAARKISTTECVSAAVLVVPRKARPARRSTFQPAVTEVTGGEKRIRVCGGPRQLTSFSRPLRGNGSC